MKKLQFLFSMLLCASTAMHAQTTVIDYGTLTSTNCNIFGTGLVVSGKSHLTILGQPQNTSGSLRLEAQPINTTDNLYYDRVTAFKIEGTFLANHEYNITVLARCANTNSAMEIQAQILGSSGTSNNCTGPAQSFLPNLFYGNFVPTNQYTNVSIQVFAPNYNSNYIVFQARPDMSIPTMQAMYVKKITIEDVTPNPGTFSITASQNSRACLNTGNITFTANHVTNPNNVTVNTYRFYPEPGQWFYNGSDAPVSIDKPANAPTITLTPRACATNLKVSGQAITNIPLTVNITPKIISSTVPPFLPPITGPDTIRSYAAATASADYSISLGAISACTQPVWSIADNPNYHIQSVVSSPSTPFTATVTKNPYVYGPIVTLKVDLNMCGVNTSVTRPIVMDWKQSIFGFMAGKTMLNDNTFSVSPNPVSGNAHVNFGKDIEDGHIDIMSVEGKHVKSLEIKGSSYLDISMDDINPGIYIILVDDGKTQQKTKIIKK